MARPLPQPATTAECYLAAVVDRLDQLNAHLTGLSGRLGFSIQPPGPATAEEGPVRLREPDPPTADPVRLREPDAAPPPRSGPGSSRPAWANYADRIGVTYPAGASQRDIIAAVANAKRQTA
jgi:hypothetical protein